MTPRGGPAGDERGFTLVEVLVSMSLAMVLLFAILGASDVFNKSVSVADKATGAQDSARATVRGMVTVLRQGRVATGQTTPLPNVTLTRSDLVAATWFPSATELTPGTGTQAGWVRYCAYTNGTQSSLIEGVRVGDVYAAPGACTAADTTNGWRHAVVLNGTLQDPTRLFDYSTSACTGGSCALPAGPAVQSVGVRVAVATSPGATATYNSVVRDAVSFRNRSST
jgi:prepilin-type N-terminal cleavage/methylation domain-containing protein